MMANNHINELIATDELFQLIQKENFVGWVFSLDYDNASCGYRQEPQS